MRPVKRWSVLLSLSIALCAACRKEEWSDFKLYRFIDELHSENILESPYLGPSEAGRIEQAAPPKSVALVDLGSGENPFFLKKKLKLKGSEINILFAPTPSIYGFEPAFAGGGTIEFGIGLIQDKDAERPSARDSPTEEGVRFQISLEENGGRTVLFRHFIALPLPGNHRISHHSIADVGLRKGTRLIFETEGGQGRLAFWENPVIYGRARRTRSAVLVSVDTLRPDHLGCYGYYRETSPAIDALADDGTLFLNTYASSPWTLPSHVSLLTSLNGVRHQVYYEDDKMSPDQITLADLMRAGGFMTAAFTDGGFLSRVYGFSRGFDSYQEREDGVLSQDSAMRIRRMASRWLDRHKEKDFFLFLHTYQPHDPYACPRPYATMFLEDNPVWRSLNLRGHLGGYAGIYRELPEKERQNIIGLYDGEIRYTDEALVRPLVGKLKELGLYDSSLIILTSDHGEEFFDHRSWTHGHQLYDEALKVPLVIKFPKGRFKGQRPGSIVRLVDIMPTILEEFGIPTVALAMDGRSLFPVLRGKERGDRSFLADIGDNILKSHAGRKTAMNSGRDKMILNKPYSPEDLLFFTSPPRLVPPVEMFDLSEDPQEKRNLADERPAAARALNERMVEIYRKAGRRQPVKVELDEPLKERLRALGYNR